MTMEYVLKYTFAYSISCLSSVFPQRSVGRVFFVLPKRPVPEVFPFRNCRSLCNLNICKFKPKSSGGYICCVQGLTFHQISLLGKIRKGSQLSLITSEARARPLKVHRQLVMSSCLLLSAQKIHICDRIHPQALTFLYFTLTVQTLGCKFKIENTH